MPAPAAPRPPNSSLFLGQPRPPAFANGHNLWLVEEGLVLWPPPAPQNRDGTPKGGARPVRASTHVSGEPGHPMDAQGTGEGVLGSLGDPGFSEAQRDWAVVGAFQTSGPDPVLLGIVCLVDPL